MSADIKDFVINTLSESLGIPYKLIETSFNIFYNNIDSELEVMHPAFNNDNTSVSFILKLSVKHPDVNFVQLLKYYGVLVGSVSPLLSQSKLSELVKKNGLNFVMSNDSYTQLVFNQSVVLNMTKIHNALETGYKISFNPTPFKYYKSELKEEIMSKIIVPTIKMYFTAISTYSPLFFKQDDDINSIIKKILLLIEASFNKKKYDGVIEVEKTGDFPLIIEVKQSLLHDKKIIEIYNVNSIRYKGNKIRPVNNRITL